MEVDEENWIDIATSNIDKYLHRGGNGKGNEPQLLKISDLFNTMGIAMGLPLADPAIWTQSDLDKAASGELIFFTGKSFDAIFLVYVRMILLCNTREDHYITVIPIELYFENKLYEVPIFKVQSSLNSKVYYVDHIGRYYVSYSDWYANNSLPPCKMIFPQQLELISNGNHVNVSSPYDTPSARTGTKILEDIDLAAGIVGISSAIGLMIVSGPAAPVIALAGVASAVWGTGRATTNIVDRYRHGQSINPFTDSTARVLWLGIAATIASFGATGATMRLSSAVARMQVSNALIILTNVMNGLSVTLNTAAIINNTIYLVTHIKQMTPSDILLNVALLAFWTKGTFCYRSSNTVIRDAQNLAFTKISQELHPDIQKEFMEVRNRVQNDMDLLNLFKSASKSNISIKQYSEFLIDGMHYYDTVAKLKPEQIEAFKNLRNFVQDDLQLLSGLQRVSVTTNGNRHETLEVVLSLWQKYTISNTRNTSELKLVDGNLLMGNAPPISVKQLPQLSPSLIRFVGEYLSKIESHTVDQWSLPEILMLQDRGLFTNCQVTGISKVGYSTVYLNGKLQISLKKLNTIPDDTCRTMLKMIGQLKPEQTTSSSKLPSDVVKLCVREMRLRFEVHRRESVEWALKSVTGQKKLTDIVKLNLLPHEQDRLYTFRTEVNMMKADTYMIEMMNFVSEMNPKNVSEMVAYSEFVMTYMDETVATIEKSIRNGTTKLPHNTKKTIWLRQQAKEATFRDITAMKQKLNELMTMVENNDMYGIQVVEQGLSDDALVAAIRTHRIRFGGKVSAAYHIYKHGTEPPSAYIEQANSTMRSPSSEYTVSIGQEGDSRIISFKDTNGGAIVLEKDGRVLLCSFRANDRK